MTTYFTADTHIDHEGIIEMMGLPHKCVDDFNEEVINGINSVVGVNDRLILAGDAAWRTVTNFLGRLVCKNIHLIIGNHDKTSFGKQFKSVADVGEFKIAGDHTVFVSHYPHCYWPASHYGSLHLYGHLHDQREATLDQCFPARRSMDCGIYTARRLLGAMRPFSEHEIISILEPRAGHDHVLFYGKKQQLLSGGPLRGAEPLWEKVKKAAIHKNDFQRILREAGVDGEEFAAAVGVDYPEFCAIINYCPGGCFAPTVREDAANK